MEGGFPAAKLILQLCRQITKPLSTSIIDFAKERPTFRQHFLITPGQYYHWCDNVMKIYLRSDKLNNARTDFEITRIKNIDEAKAMEVGAQLMIETLVFLILATFVIYESSKSAGISQLLEETKEQELTTLNERKNDLSRRLERQAALIQELHSTIHNYSKEVGYSLPQLPQRLASPDLSLPNSDNSS